MVDFNMPNGGSSKLALHLVQEQSYALPSSNASTANGPGGALSPHLVCEVGGDARTRGAYTVEEQAPVHTQAEGTM